MRLERQHFQQAIFAQNDENGRQSETLCAATFNVYDYQTENVQGKVFAVTHTGFWPGIL